MVLQAASIVFNDNAGQYNKDLTDFLRRNIETAVRKGGMTFQFKIAKPSDLSSLRKRGIKSLPAMSIGKKNYIGVPDIIGEIRRRVRTSNHEEPIKTEEEQVRDYQMQFLGQGVKKDAEGKFTVSNDDENDDKESMMSKFNRELQRRGASAGHGDSDDGERRPRPSNPARQTEQDDDDDDDDDEEEHYAKKRQPARRMQSRADNIENPDMADAFESLKSIGRHSTGDDAQDDAMMGNLLERMGAGG